MGKDATQDQALLGATWLGEGRCRFLVWAPFAERVEVCLRGSPERTAPLSRLPYGYHEKILEEIEPGAQYFFALDGRLRRADPASRYQPAGVFGPSAVVPGDFAWSDAAWRGLPLRDSVFYELHIGTFSREGTFEAVIPRLAELKALGVTAIEIMPVAEFPGVRNWGYDGIFPFAVEHTYGGPVGLKRLVNACHEHQLAVTLDVVYNHIGPEGNYFRDFGPYFTERYRTPWGAAINFDGPESDEVRRFFLENALYWIREFHIDALRLDAIHAIMDQSARPFLQEVTSVVKQQAEQLNRQVHLIAESDLNDVRVIRPRANGGYGFDSQWSDGFHHALHTLLTREHDGYYQDYGRVSHLAKAYSDGFVYSGEYSAFRRRRYGNSAQGLPGQSLVICAQNHDQVGNRAYGERLSTLLDFESLKLAAAAVLLAPFLPLLFMGEEYGETAPFLYFTSHESEELAEAVRRGRREEFLDFAWGGDVPDPQAETTFERSKLRPDEHQQESHRCLRKLYRSLLDLRRNHPALADLGREHLQVLSFEDSHALYVGRRHDSQEVVQVLNFARNTNNFEAPIPPGTWRKIFDSAEDCWLGPGGPPPAELSSGGSARLELNPRSLVMYERSSKLS